MGHGKLKKFAENATFRCLVQPDASAVLDKEPGSKALRLHDHPIKGRWGAQLFGNDHPIVLELGCGKGDYTIALARRHPEINYIGVDIKGARLWKGAKEATETAMPNVAFLRTRIEFIEAFFGPGEVSEIWLTFSDPQLRGSENSRLSSPLFLERYRKFLVPGGIIHLKTDSRYLYEYTKSVIEVNGLQVIAYSTDLYGILSPAAPARNDRENRGTIVIPSEAEGSLRSSSVIPSEDEGSLRGSSVIPSEDEGSLRSSFVIPSEASVSHAIDFEAVTQVQTFYEQMFLQMGLPITYLAFCPDHEGPYAFPGEAFDHDYWLAAEGPRRSFSHQPAKSR